MDCVGSNVSFSSELTKYNELHAKTDQWNVSSEHHTCAYPFNLEEKASWTASVDNK